MTETVPRVYIFHFRDGHSETLIGATAQQAIVGNGHAGMEDVDCYEAPADEKFTYQGVVKSGIESTMSRDVYEGLQVEK